jgi:excisionase family DNA binding protein
MGMDTAIKEAVREVMNEQMERLREALASAPGRRATDEFWPVRRAAQVAGVSPATVRGWIQSKRLRSYGAGRVLRIRRSEFEAFLTSMAKSPSEPVDVDERVRAILAETQRSTTRAKGTR